MQDSGYVVHADQTGLPIATNLTFNEALLLNVSLQALKPINRTQTALRSNPSESSLSDIQQAFIDADAKLQEIQTLIGSTSYSLQELKQSVTKRFDIQSIEKSKRAEVGRQMSQVLSELELIYTERASLALKYAAHRIATEIVAKMEQKVAINSNLIIDMICCRADKFISFIENPNLDRLSKAQQTYIANMLSFLAFFIDTHVQDLDSQFFATIALFRSTQLDTILRELKRIEVQTPTGSHYATPTIQGLLIIARYSTETQFEDFLKTAQKGETINTVLSKCSFMQTQSFGFEGLAELYQAAPFTASAVKLACDIILGYESIKGLGLEDPLVLSILKKRQFITSLTERKGLFDTIVGVVNGIQTIDSEKLKSLIQGGGSDLKVVARGVERQVRTKQVLSSDYFFKMYVSCEDIPEGVSYMEWGLSLVVLWAEQNNPPLVENMESWRPYLNAYKDALYKNLTEINDLIIKIRTSPKLQEYWRGFSKSINDFLKKNIQEALHEVDFKLESQDLFLQSKSGEPLLESILSRPLMDPLLLLFIGAVNITDAEFADLRLLSWSKLTSNLTPKSSEGWVSRRYNPLSLISGIEKCADCCVQPWNHGTSVAFIQFLFGPKEPIKDLSLEERAKSYCTVAHVYYDMKGYETIPQILGCSYYYPTQIKIASLNMKPFIEFVYGDNEIDFIFRDDSLVSPMFSLNKKSKGLVSDGQESWKQNTFPEQGDLVSRQREAVLQSLELGPVIALTNKKPELSLSEELKDKETYGVPNNQPTPNNKVYTDYRGDGVPYIAPAYFGFRLANPTHDFQNLEVVLDLNGSEHMISYDGMEPLKIDNQLLLYIFSWPKGFKFLPKNSIVIYVDDINIDNAQNAIQLLYPTWFITDKPLTYEGAVYDTLALHKARTPKRFILCDKHNTCVDLIKLHKATMHRGITQAQLTSAVVSK